MYDISASATYKVTVSDVVAVKSANPTNPNNWFDDIYVRRRAYISGIIAGSTGTSLISGLYPGILAGLTNRAVGDYSSVLAGSSNLSSGASATVAGDSNTVFGQRSSILGGTSSFVRPTDSAIVAGDTNQIVGSQANTSAILAGANNVITGNSTSSAVIAGNSNRVMGIESVIVAGNTNLITGGATDSAILAGLTNVVSGNYSAVGAGTTNKIAGPATDSFIAAGQLHIINDQYDFIGAGTSNQITGNRSAIVAGSNNSIENVARAFIGAGISNMASGTRAGIVAGSSNRVSGGNDMFIGAGIRNVISGDRSSIVGGSDNTIYTEHGIIGGGKSNIVSGNESVVAGGNLNIVNGRRSVIAGGAGNLVEGVHSVIGGGNSNRIWTDTVLGTAVIAGGENNQVIGSYGAILGGDINKVSGVNGVVIGGSSNVSSGRYSMTMGVKCEAFQDGSVIFGDSSNVVKKSYGQDSFTLNYSGGAWITGGGLNARRGFNLYPTGDDPVNYTTPGRSGDFAYKDQFLYVYTGDPADSNRGWGRVQLSTLDNTPPSVCSNDSSIIHTRGDTYDLTNAFAAVIFNNGASPIISIPAGNGTYVIDCVFGACKGSTTALTIDYFLYNTSDSRMIPGTSGVGSLSASFGSPPTQFITKTITGTNYGAAKNIQLYAKTTLVDSAVVHSTGTFISYIKLR